MISATPKLTRKGLDMSASVASGGTLEFTKFAIGSGTIGYSDDPSRFTDLKEKRHEFGIDKIEKNGTSVSIQGTFDSSLLTSAFRLRELGIFCKDSSGVEHLFAYSNDGDKAGQIENLPDASVEQTITLIFAFSATENVTATLTGASAYATRADVEAHVNDHNNPHGVTKETVGLGNVPNVTTNNQTVTYVVSTAADISLVSGEKMSVAFGKIAAAIRKLANHIADHAAHLDQDEHEKLTNKINEAYVVEEGMFSTDGRDASIWAGDASYRKWSDGSAEIWGWQRFNNIEFRTAFMGGYRGVDQETKTQDRFPIWGDQYPGGIEFVGYPSISLNLAQCDALGSVSGVGVQISTMSVDGKTRLSTPGHPPTFVVTAGNVGTLGHPVFGFIIRGRWK